MYKYQAPIAHVFLLLVTIFQVFSDKAIERSVLSLHVRCSYFSAGCEWSGELRDLEVIILSIL